MASFRTHNNGGKALLHRKYLGASTLSFRFESVIGAAIGQGEAKFIHSGVRDLRAVEKERLDVGQFLQVFQARVGDASIEEIKLSSVGQFLQVFQAGVHDLC